VYCVFNNQPRAAAVRLPVAERSGPDGRLTDLLSGRSLPVKPVSASDGAAEGVNGDLLPRGGIVPLELEPFPARILVVP